MPFQLVTSRMQKSTSISWYFKLRFDYNINIIQSLVRPVVVYSDLRSTGTELKSTSLLEFCAPKSKQYDHRLQKSRKFNPQT